MAAQMILLLPSTCPTLATRLGSGACAFPTSSSSSFQKQEFKTLTWSLTNWGMLARRLTSPTFECGGHKWYNLLATHLSLLTSAARHLNLFPFSNASPKKDSLSVYLRYAGSSEFPEGWHTCVQFAVAASNTQDPTIFIVRCQCSAYQLT